MSDHPSAIHLYNDLLGAVNSRQPLTTVTRLYAAYVTACHGGNLSRSAQVLGVHRRTLHRWCKPNE